MRYLVKRAWVGASVGDVIETDNLHEALLPHVELIKDDRSFEVATPKPSKSRKRKQADQGDEA